MTTLRANNEQALRLSTEGRLAATALCPFGAITAAADGALIISAACKMCRICVNKGPAGLFELLETEEAIRPVVDKAAWNGVAVFIEQTEGRIHPVSLELLGKAGELARKVKAPVAWASSDAPSASRPAPVYAVIIGCQIQSQADELTYYGVNEVFLYDDPALDVFLMEPYANAFIDFIEKVKPSVVLVGATVLGRSLAPRVAARMRTGLTADCTKLDIKENTDLVQIRPAFGGNIMAQIVTPNHRPQLATVRYKVFDAPPRRKQASGMVTLCTLPPDQLSSRIVSIALTKKEAMQSLTDAEIIIAAGRGLKKEKDLEMVYELAKLLDAQVAGTRPMVEAGWIAPHRQIGLSGRTVKPKLIITLGVSGAVQFKAGMENAGLIVAINTDEHAPINNFCHYAIHGDLYEVVPALMDKIKEGKLAYV
jgi:electron transfer flavoprotein alpha subunit